MMDGNRPPGEYKREIDQIKLSALRLAFLRMRLDSNEPLEDILIGEMF